MVLAHLFAPKVTPQLPYADEMKIAGLTPIATSTSDPRYVRNDLKTLPENSILWVAGSSITIKENKNGALTYLPTELDIQQSQYVSLKMAQRGLDSYTLVNDALSREPSALVVVLNPFWTLNDNALFFKKNVINAGSSQWMNGKDWTLIPLLASPADMLWGAFGRHHQLSANGHDYLKLIKSTHAKPQPAKTPKNKPSKRISYNQPLAFWSTQRHAEGKDFSTFGANEWQIEAMNQNNLTQSAWSKKLLKNMLEKIKNSNIPTLIYVAPISPKLERTSAREAYRTVTHQLRDITAPYQSTQIKIITEFPASVIDGLTFTDYIHLQNSGALPAYLNTEINALLEER